jgi:hypothetical protein
MNQDSNLDQIDSIKEIKDSGSPDSWKWRFWNEELGRAILQESEYIREAERIQKIYKGHRYTKNQQNALLDLKGTYNILYSNIETLKPLLFSHLPNPKVRKRNLEKSNVNRLVSILLERNIKRILEVTDAQTIIKQARNDYLITKRGNVRVRLFQEIIKTKEIDNEGLEIDSEEPGEKRIEIEYVSWKNILYSPCEKWEDVEWIAFRHKLTQLELKEKFGAKKAKEIGLGSSVNNQVINDNNQPEGLLKRAEVYEIWDRMNKKVIYFAAGYSKDILAENEDGYKLEKFFNIPRPLGIDSGVDNILCPIPDYKYYQQQATELDTISERILAILPFMSMGGAYNSVIITADAENFLKNSIDNYAPLNIKGDIDIRTLIYERDLSKLSVVLNSLYAERQQTIAAIQQITGISDIVRGQTVASETATAQELKGNFAVSRIQPMQQEMEFFCRDIVRLIAELIAEHYSAQELAIAAQIKVFDMDKIAENITTESEMEDQNRPQPMTQEERQMFFKTKMTPYMNEIKSGQATTVNLLLEADKVLKNDKLRTWSIEIETDSTIKVDQNTERQSVLDFSNAVATVSQQFLPLVQSGIFSKDTFRALLSYIMRRFEGSEEVEELLDDTDTSGSEEDKQKQAAQMQMAQKEIEFKEREIGVKEFSAKSKADYEQGKLKVDEAKAILDAEIATDDIENRTENVQRRIEESSLYNKNLR